MAVAKIVILTRPIRCAHPGVHGAEHIHSGTEPVPSESQKTSAMNPSVLEPEKMTKEEIIAAILQCTEELRHAPTVGELLTRTKVSLYAIRRTFGNYQRALKACGLERDGS